MPSTGWEDRCVCVVGTRPEVIKMAPIIRRLSESKWGKPVLITSGQQDHLLQLALNDFNLIPTHSFPHDSEFGGIIDLLGSVAGELSTLFKERHPACVIAQGDTTTVFAASLAAFYQRIPFVHVEAGLRSADLSSPYPEEFHRRAIALSTAMHCAPTLQAAENLKRENISPELILVSGNTVIDALLETVADDPAPPASFPSVPRTILMTAHRRENFGARLRDAFHGVRAFVDLFPDTAVFFPLHPHPEAQSAAREILSNHDRIRLVEPLSYRDMVAALKKCWLVLSDSGGLQEEAPALGKPVLVLRDVTERPEAIGSGVVQLVGTTREKVFGSLKHLYTDGTAYDLMARAVFPYGDGHAAKRIISSLPQFIGGLGQTGSRH